MTEIKNLNWKDILQEEKEKDYFKKVFLFQQQERKKGLQIYPPQNKIFQAFKLTEFLNIKVVILGQDPYHGAGQAEGLSFSVPENFPLPPSLKNIYKEIEKDLGIKMGKNGHLESWAKQGVFLLNSVLTVEEGRPASHANIGWENFTDEVIKKISDEKTNIVFLLWGNYAKKKMSLIDNEKHLILTASHPSPLGAHQGFFGSKHFSQTNEYLKQNSLGEIDWEIK